MRFKVWMMIIIIMMMIAEGQCIETKEEKDWEIRPGEDRQKRASEGQYTLGIKGLKSRGELKRAESGGKSYLFIHQNFPAQWRHVSRELAEDPRNMVAFLSNNMN